MLNAKLKSYLESPEGPLMFSLVHDFLQFFDLDCTISVFEPESYQNLYKKLEREKITEILGLNNEDPGPLLLNLIKTKKIEEIPIKEIENLNLNYNNDSPIIKKPDATYTKQLPEEDDTIKSVTEEANEDQSATNKTIEEETKANHLSVNSNGQENYEDDFMSGSEVEFSLNKVDCPESLLQELEKSDLMISSNQSQSELSNGNHQSSDPFLNNNNKSKCHLSSDDNSF